MNNEQKSKARLAADSQRAEAKQILLNIFKIPPGHSNGQLERLVDCIIGAAMLEICDSMTSGYSMARADIPQGDGS